MHIFAIANGKGGVGKTTLSGHLGVNMTKRDYYTVVMDLDPLACLQEWWEEREADDLPLMSVPIDGLADAIKQLEEAGVEILIIDTPGFISNDLNAVFNMADLVVVASKASPLDLKATRKSLKWLEDCKTPLVFVLNEVKKNTRIASEAVMALSQHGKLGPIIHSWTDAVSSMGFGMTLEEVSPQAEGALEIDSLTDYLLGQVGIQAPNPVTRELVVKGDGESAKKPAKQTGIRPAKRSAKVTNIR